MGWTADHVQQIEAAPEDVGLSSAGMARLTREDLAVVFMTQVRPSSTYPIRRELRALIYGAIVD